MNGRAKFNSQRLFQTTRKCEGEAGTHFLTLPWPSFKWSSAIVFAIGVGVITGSSPGFLHANVTGGGATNPVVTEPPPVLSASNKLISYGKLPLSFEANQGQTDSEVKFLSRGPGYTIFLTDKNVVLVLDQFKSPKKNPTDHPTSSGQLSKEAKESRGSEVPLAEKPTVISMQFAGANSNPKVSGFEKLPGVVNYLIGNNPEKWRTNIPTYAKVEYKEMYPGIDVVFYGNPRQLEYDFVVAPGADPNQITMNFQGAEGMTLEENGDLKLKTGGAQVRLLKPRIYQAIEGTKQIVAGHYTILRTDDPQNSIKVQSSSPSVHQVGIQVAAYDAARPLIIDPGLVYSSYAGGGGEDAAFGIAVDGDRNAYLVGKTSDITFPMGTEPNPYQPGYTGGAFDTFVMKINPGGDTVLFSTFLGGSREDIGNEVVYYSNPGQPGPVDDFIIVMGSTTSDDFPLPVGGTPLQSSKAGNNKTTDGYVATLNPGGTQLLCSTYIGGSQNDSVNGGAVDGSGNIFLAGETKSTNFPISGTLLTNNNGFIDAFVAQMNSNCSALAYSSYIGGSKTDRAHDLALDGGGNVYIVGETFSENFPLVNEIQTGGATRNSPGAFVTMVNPAGDAIVFSTLLGGTGDDSGNGIALDPSTVDPINTKNVHVVGTTLSSTFLTDPNPTNPTLLGGTGGVGGNSEAFVAELNFEVATSTLALTYLTYLIGGGEEFGNSIDVDNDGHAHVTGETTSNDFPTVGAVQGANGGNSDAFVAELEANGAALAFSTYHGGSGNDAGNSITLDFLGHAYVGGQTASSANDFPTASFQTAFGGGVLDAAVWKYGNETPVAVSQTFALGTEVTTLEDTSVAITLAASDIDGPDPLDFTVNAPSHGSVVPTSGAGNCIANGTGFDCTFNVTYTPDLDFNSDIDSESFTFTANDGIVDSNVATVEIDVTPVNDAPEFTKGLDQVVIQSPLVQTISGWATGIVAGPPATATDETAGQTLTQFIVSNDNNALFATQPSVDVVSGDLTFTTPTPALPVDLDATIDVALMDDGGIANGGVDTSASQFSTIRVLADSDLDGFVDIGEEGFPQDNCPTTYNPDQDDADFDGFGDACDVCIFDDTNTGDCLLEILAESLTLNVPGTVKAGEPIPATVVLQASKPLLTFRPTCLTLAFHVTLDNGAIVPPKYVEGRPKILPTDLIFVDGGNADPNLSAFAVTCDVGALVEPSLLPQNANINITVAYSNFFLDEDWDPNTFTPGDGSVFPPPLAGTCGADPCYEVWAGSVETEDKSVTIQGLVNRIEGAVTFDPTKWAIQWATGSGLTVSANLTVPAGLGVDVNDIDTTDLINKPIVLNGTAQAISTSGPVNGVLTAVFNAKDALDSLPQPPPLQVGDTFHSNTITATFTNEDIFTAEGGPIEVVVAQVVLIDSPNSINPGAKGAIPVELYSTLTFDATELDATTLIFGGATVLIKGGGRPQATTNKDLNPEDGLGLKDMKAQFDNEQFNLPPTGPQTVIFEGFMNDGTPVYGELIVDVQPK